MADDAKQVQLSQINKTIRLPKTRIDVYKTPIIKGSTHHKIIFRDEAKMGNLLEIFIVESFKEYNVELPQSQKKTQICDCVIS